MCKSNSFQYILLHSCKDGLIVTCTCIIDQACALAEPGGLWCLTFVLGKLENLCFSIEIICWAHWILQVQSTGLPSIFLRVTQGLVDCTWEKAVHSSPSRRKTLIPNLQYVAAIPSYGKGFRSKPRGVPQESEPLRQFVGDFQPHFGSSCDCVGTKL